MSSSSLAALRAVDSAPSTSAELAQVSDQVAQLSLDEATDQPFQIDPKDWKTISRMVSQIAGDLSKLETSERDALIAIGREVQTLVLYNLPAPLPAPVVKTLAGHFSNLTHLQIVKVDDATLRELRLPILTKLILEDCRGVTNDGMKFLSSLTNLKTLKIVDCFADSGIVHLSSLTKLRCLTFIRHNEQGQVTERELVPLFKSLTEMRTLHIEPCTVHIDADGVFESAFNFMTKLRKIDLLGTGMCVPETLMFFGSLLQTHPTLHAVNSNSINIHTDETFLALLDILDPNIQELTVTGCYNISAPSIATLLKKFPKLERAELHNCSDVDPRALVKLTGSLHKQQIHLFGCERFSELNEEDFLSKTGQKNSLTDDRPVDLFNIASAHVKNPPFFRVYKRNADPTRFLNALGTEKTLLIQSKMRTLSHLYVKTDERFLQLLEKLDPKTTEFVAIGCYKVSVSSIVTLLERFPKLQTITLHNCLSLDPCALTHLMPQLKKQQIQVFDVLRFDELGKEDPSFSTLRNTFKLTSKTKPATIDIRKANDTPARYLACIDKLASTPTYSDTLKALEKEKPVPKKSDSKQERKGAVTVEKKS